ncbi:MAG: AEC family transporter [Propionicimonas sp.]
MFEIAARALSLVAIVGIGLGIKRLGWVTKEHFGLFAKLVLGVTLPCALLTSFNDYHLDRALLGLTVLGLLVNVVQQGIGYLLALRRGRREQAFAVLNSGTYNIGAFATPYLSGFMGPHAMIYSSLFDIGNAVASAGIGYGWGTALAGEQGAHRWRDTARTLATSPVFVTYIGLLLLKLFDLRLPDVLITFTSTVGAANPFLAMLMIGIGLELRLHRSKYVAAARHLAVRYAFSVVVAVACWTLLPLPVEARVVLVMLLFAPIASMVPGFTGKAGLDVELSAFMTSVTLVIGIIVMPSLYLLLA